MSAPSPLLGFFRQRPRRSALFALLALGAAGVWAFAGDSAERAWHRVEHRDLIREVKVEGELTARHAAEFGPPVMTEMWNFKIATMAPEGAEVQIGDAVLAFDDSELRQRLERTLADRDKAEKTLEKRRTDLAIARRTAALRFEEAQAAVRRAQLQVDVPSELLARNELDAARVDLDLARIESSFSQQQLARTEQGSQAELEALEHHARFAADLVRRLEGHIQRMSVHTDRPGTVIYRSNWQGDKRRVGDTVWREEVVLSIPDLTSQIAIVDVDEAESSRVALGQKVALRLDAHPDRSYRATVAKIHRSVQQRTWRDPRRIMRVELELEAVDVERMRPGMRLTGTIEVERIAQVLALPLEAIVSTPGPNGSAATVLIASPLGERWVQPQLGRRNQRWVEVLSGLDAGDRVLLPTGADGPSSNANDTNGEQSERAR